MNATISPATRIALAARARARAVDARNEPKPPARAWVNGQSIWFQVYRRDRPYGRKPGAWIPITRVHRKTAQAAQWVKAINAARAELANLDALKAEYPEPLAQRAARVYGGVQLVELGVSA